MRTIPVPGKDYKFERRSARFQPVLGSMMQLHVLLLLLLTCSHCCLSDGDVLFDCRAGSDFCMFALRNGSQSEGHEPAENIQFSVRMKQQETHNVIQVDCPDNCSQWQCTLSFKENAPQPISLTITLWRNDSESSLSASYSQHMKSKPSVTGWFQHRVVGQMGMLIDMSKSVNRVSKTTFLATAHVNITDNNGKRTNLSLNSAEARPLFTRSQSDSRSSGNTTTIIILSVSGVLIVLLFVIIAVALFGIRREVTLRSSTRASIASQ